MPSSTATSQGLEAYILSDEMEGESREVGKVYAALARAVALRGQPFSKPCVILSGGETTVTVRSRQPGDAKGRGGRAGEFRLGLALALQGQPGVYALAADTDGMEDNAGAFVAPDTLTRAVAQGMKVVASWTATTPMAISRRSAIWSSPGPRTPMSTTSAPCWCCEHDARCEF